MSSRYMRRLIAKKTLVFVLAISLIVPGSLLFYPNQTKAQQVVTCASRVASALGLNAASNVAGAILAVPTNDIGNKAAFTTSSISNFGSFFGDCVLKPIALRLANAVLHNMTNSIVNWINSGFKGNPAFVTNLHGLLSDSTDQVLGQFIQYDLGAGFLCKSFALQVKLAVAQTYLPFKDRATCTLTEIEKNVNGFIKNDNSGGWDNWLEVTTQPQNNVWGATVLAQDEVSKKIFDVQSNIKDELNWGKGFKSWKVCTVAVDPATGMATLDPSNINPDTDSRCRDSKIQTPGGVIQDMLTNSLGSDMRRLEVANDLDAIIGALVDQLTNQVITGAKGLLGTGKSSSSSNSSSALTTYQGVLNGNVSDASLSTFIDSSVQQSVTDNGLDTIFNTTVGTNTPAVANTSNTTDDQGNVIENSGPLSWSVDSNTIIVNASSSFAYNINLNSTDSETGLNIQTTLRKDGLVMPFLSAFSSFQVSYGRSDGTIATKYLSSNTDSSAMWSRVSVDPNIPFIFKFSGTKNSSAQTGIYTLETAVSNSSGNILKVQTDSFTVQ